MSCFSSCSLSQTIFTFFMEPGCQTFFIRQSKEDMESQIIELIINEMMVECYKELLEGFVNCVSQQQRLGNCCLTVSSSLNFLLPFIHPYPFLYSPVFYQSYAYKLSVQMSYHRRLYSSLNVEDTHSALIKKIASTSDKSSQVLLGMMVRKNKEVQDTISQYSLLHKIKHQKPKTLPRVKAATLVPIQKQRSLRISLDTEDYKALKELRRNRDIADLATPKKKPFEIKDRGEHVRAQSKLSIIQFPTFGAELQLSSSSKKPSTQQFVRRQLSSLCSTNFNQFNKVSPLVSPSVLSSHQQQLLLEEFDSTYKPNLNEKQNKPIQLRVRTFKSFQQHQSVRVGTSRPCYLKPIPVESFFTKFQSESTSRAELIQSRMGVKKKG